MDTAPSQYSYEFNDPLDLHVCHDWQSYIQCNHVVWILYLCFLFSTVINSKQLLKWPVINFTDNEMIIMNTYRYI